MTRLKRVDTRFWVNHLGSFYQEALKIDSWVHNRSQPQQAASILIDYLKATKNDRDKKLEEFAEKLGISKDELINRIIGG